MRGLGRLLVALLVLAGLLVGLDRGAAYVATRQLASKVQTAEGLPERPGAAIRGFPFLTQVLDGRYDEVDLTARGLVRNGVRLDSVALRAQGVRVDVREALRGEVHQVPVQRGEGTVLLSFADLNALLARYSAGAVTVSSTGGSRLTVKGAVSLLGVGTSVSAEVAEVRVADGRLLLQPLPAGLDALPSALRGQARDLLTLSLPLPALPFGLHVTRAQVTPLGVTATAEGQNIVIPVQQQR